MKTWPRIGRRGHALAAACVLALPLAAAALGDPPAYTRGWGEWAQGCVYCHGRPPTLPHSQSASRIVAVGAALADGAALRRAMQREELGGAMRRQLEDPELTDEVLETIRRYLVEVRDGALRAELVVPSAGAPPRVEFRNLRTPHDEPVRIAALQVSGPFRLGAGSTCRVRLPLRGGHSCTLVLQRRAGTHRNADGPAVGALLIRLGATPGLTPQPRTMQLAGEPR
jgi:hypothetical protein